MVAKGSRMSEDARQKMRKPKTYSPEARARMSAERKSRRLTDETKAKMSKANTGRRYPNRTFTTHITCVVCGKDVLQKAPRQRYCSRACYRVGAHARKFGLSIQEFQEWKAGTACAICGNTEKRMTLDHDHATGRVRNVLCWHCNAGLGNFGDDPARLRLAAEYIETGRL